ncbi:MAG: spore maturation protein CgeB [Chlamydiales bacterium]|jgi:spore maturation protein CgeB
MTLKKMIFFMPDGQYGATQHFTNQLCKAMVNNGVQCEIFDFEEQDVFSVMEIVKKEKPDCTCTFNPILPLHDGRLFCDHLKTPHVNLLVDASLETLYLLQSPYSIITCVEMFFSEFLKSGGFENAFFFPHGVEADFQRGEESEKKYDVTMLGTCIDYEEINSKWEEAYSPQVIEVIRTTVDKVFSDDRSPYFLTLLKELESAKITPDEVEVTQLCREVERYIKGKGRADMIKSIKDAPVHVFGRTIGARGWEYYLEGQKNVTIHDSVPFEKTMEIMRESKVLLSSVPFFKYGSHERLFYGLAAGAAVVTDDTLFNSSQFQEAEGVLIYQHWDSDKINGTVNEFVGNDERRRHFVEQGREKVMREYTWDCRAKQLIEELPVIIDRIKAVTQAVS